MAASPDGLVFRDGEDTPTGIIEIKCPFSFRFKPSIEDLTVNGKCLFCYIEETTEAVKLKRSHDYFYQVQGQMAVVGVQWCDFIIWAPAFIHVERIYYDDTFWNTKGIPRLTSFYTFCFIPRAAISTAQQWI